MIFFFAQNKDRGYPRGYSDIFYIGWAFFFFFFWGGGSKFSISIVLGSSTKIIIFWGVGGFCGYFLGVTSKFDYVFGLFTKINYCYLCYVMKYTSTTIKYDGQGK